MLWIDYNHTISDKSESIVFVLLKTFHHHHHHHHDHHHHHFRLTHRIWAGYLDWVNQSERQKCNIQPFVFFSCVAENQRPFALGLQFVLMRTLGALPGTILFGHVIDSTCQVWRMKCGVRLSCADYNNDQLGLYIVTFGLPLQSECNHTLLLTWICCFSQEPISRSEQLPY